jgi:hypothetical protein
VIGGSQPAVVPVLWAAFGGCQHFPLQKREMATTDKRQRKGADGGEGGSGKSGSDAHHQQQAAKGCVGSDVRGQELPGESGFREAEREG